MEEINTCAKCGTELILHRFNDGGVNEWEEEICPKCSDEWKR